MGFFDLLFPPPSEDKFAQIMADMLRKVGDDRTSSYDKDEYRLRFTKDGKSAGFLNLRNLFAEYCRAPRKERTAWLHRITLDLLNQMEIPDEFADARHDLLPTVRSRSMLEITRLDAELQGHEQPLDLPWTQLSEHLAICLVYDLPASMRFVTQDNLKTWGVSLYEAVEAAIANLEERDFVMISVGEKLYILETGDAYDGSRLLLKERIRGLKLTGNPVAIAITRDCLLVTGAEDVEGLGIMAALAASKLNEARPLCPVAVELVRDEWETWSPPAGHPHGDAFRRLKSDYLGTEYTEQKRLLEKLHEATGRDVFVSSYSQAQRDKLWFTFCIWPKNVLTWIPKTDYVIFCEELGSKDHRFVAWERMQEAVGDLLEPLDCYPPRWQTNGFPNSVQIERMAPEAWQELV